VPPTPRQNPPTLDYETPQPVAWRPNWPSILVNTFSIAFYVLVILAFITAGFGYLP
jgi:hypothetical protein